MKMKKQVVIVFIIALLLPLVTPFLSTNVYAVEPIDSSEYNGNIGRKILVLNYANIIVSKDRIPTAKDSLERKDILFKLNNETNLETREKLRKQAEETFQGSNTRRVDTTLGEIEFTGQNKVKLKHTVEVPLIEKEPMINATTSLDEYEEYSYNWGNSGMTPSVNPGLDWKDIQSSSAYNNVANTTVTIKNPANNEVGNAIVVKEQAGSVNNTDGKTIKPTTYSKAVYDVETDIVLSDRNRLKIPDKIIRDTAKFRWDNNGNATLSDYENIMRDMKSTMYSSNRLYQLQDKSYGQKLDGIRMPVEFLENLLVESYEDTLDRIDIYEVIIPTVITITDTRSNRVREIVGNSSCSNCSSSTHHYNFYERSKGSDYLYEDLGKGRTESPAVELIDDGYGNVSIWGENKSPSRSLDKHLTTDPAYVNEFTGVVREKSTITSPINIGESAKYTLPALVGGKPYGNKYYNSIPIKEPLPKANESIYHRARTVVPKTSSPPNIITGLPVEVLGYSAGKRNIVNGKLLKPNQSLDGREMKGITSVDIIDKGVPNNGDREIPSKNTPHVKIEFQYEPRLGYYIGHEMDDKGVFNRKDYKNTIKEVSSTPKLEQGESLMIVDVYFKAFQKTKSGQIDSWNFEPGKRYYFKEKYTGSNKVIEKIDADIFVNYTLLGANGENTFIEPVKILHNGNEHKGMAKPVEGDVYRRTTSSPYEILTDKEYEGEPSVNPNISNTSMHTFLLEPQGKIIYSYLDVFDADKPNQDLQKGSAQSKEKRLTLSKERKDYQKVTEEIGTKEILSQYRKLLKPSMRYEAKRIVTTITKEKRYRKTSKGKRVCSVCAVSTDAYERSIATYNPTKPVYKDWVTWGHRTELLIQYHAAIHDVREGLYDYNNPKNKATKAGYGVIYEANGMLRTDWPNTQEIRSRMIRPNASIPMESLADVSPVDRNQKANRLNIGESNFDKNDLNTKSEELIMDKLQVRLTSNMMSEKSNPIYKLNQNEIENIIAGKDNKLKSDFIWRNLKYPTGNGNLTTDKFEASPSIPFEKLSENFEQKMEWSTMPGYHYALSRIKSGQQVVPAFGKTRQQFVHPDHPNSLYTVEPWITADFGAEYFNVSYASRLGIPVKGNMFDDTFSNVKKTK